MAGIQAVSMRSWIVGALFAGAAAIGIYIVAHAVINGPAARAMIERQNAEEVAQEDRTFCAKFGMPPDASTFRTCADSLARIRQSQEDRWKQDFDWYGAVPVAARQ
jgi:hypothetical protein